MGIHVIKMPDLGEGIAEVEVVEWRVQPGDKVTEDQILADVMTDKATVEIPSPVHGTVLALGGPVGELLAVGAELIRLEVEGVGNSTGSKAHLGTAGAPLPRAEHDHQGQRAGAVTGPAKAPPVTVAEPERVRTSATPEERPAAASMPQRQPFASAAAAVIDKAAKQARQAAPAVRQRARDLGLSLDAIHGSGPEGRIVHADLDAHLLQQQQQQQRPAYTQAHDSTGARYAKLDGEHTVQIRGLRRKIAEKMQESKRRIPHFAYVEEVDVTELEALRTQLNQRWGASRGKLTLLPLLMRAVVLAVRQFPQVNARFNDESGVVTVYQPVHLGIATQTDAGLMVPVVRHAEARDPWSSAAELGRLAEAARSGKAVREELSGSTITITSLGTLGGIVTTPVINHPEVAIVGINRIVERPVIRDGAIVARKMMNLSSSFDHRVIDGMYAAQFIQAIRASLEFPATLFVE
ncbi:MAG TPA: dihydrolipoamide acetyltransferase family protein [Telluria sp.]